MFLGLGDLTYYIIYYPSQQATLISLSVTYIIYLYFKLIVTLLHNHGQKNLTFLCEDKYGSN